MGVVNSCIECHGSEHDSTRDVCSTCYIRVRADLDEADEEIARLRDALRWRRVSEEMPPDAVTVIGAYPAQRRRLVWSQRGQWYCARETYRVNPPTHWLPIPPLEAS